MEQESLTVLIKISFHVDLRIMEEGNKGLSGACHLDVNIQVRNKEGNQVSVDAAGELFANSLRIRVCVHDKDFEKDRSKCKKEITVFFRKKY